MNPIMLRLEEALCWTVLAPLVAPGAVEWSDESARSGSTDSESTVC